MYKSNLVGTYPDIYTFVITNTYQLTDNTAPRNHLGRLPGSKWTPSLFELGVNWHVLSELSLCFKLGLDLEKLHT